MKIIFLKKITEIRKEERKEMVELNNSELSVRHQSLLLQVCRASLYYRPLLDMDSELANLIKEIYLYSDGRYGYRKVTACLDNLGYAVNHKKVLRIMREVGIQGLYPRKSINTTIGANNAIYPYLLKDLAITYPNQVWVTDLTYISIQGRFMYFMAIMDLYSCYIVAYELSPNLEAVFCVDTLKRALNLAIPQIFNTDQGSQFTGHDFINVLSAYGVMISHDHKGRCFDNIFAERFWRTLKQEAIYYYRPDTVKALDLCLNNFVDWYNNERLHQSLQYKTPAFVYQKTHSNIH